MLSTNYAIYALLCVCWLLLLQTSQRAGETADKVSSQAQATAEETKATVSDKAQQVGAGAGAWVPLSRAALLSVLSTAVAALLLSSGAFVPKPPLLLRLRNN